MSWEAWKINLFSNGRYAFSLSSVFLIFPTTYTIEEHVPPRRPQPNSHQDRPIGRTFSQKMIITTPMYTCTPWSLRRNTQAFLFDTAAATCGVEMAALWLRLRRTVIGHSTTGSPRRQHDPDDTEIRARRASDAGVRRNSGGGRQAGKGRKEAGKGSREASSDTLRLGGEVDLSRVGAGLFRMRDPDGSGSVSAEVFREVRYCPGVGWQEGGRGLRGWWKSAEYSTVGNQYGTCRIAMLGTFKKYLRKIARIPMKVV